MQDHLFFLQQAYEQALRAYDECEVPVGAVIVERGEVVSAAYNVKESQCCVTGHAEICCINQLTTSRNDWRLTGCVLYTTLEPCIMCAGAIIHARLKNVICGALDAKGGAESIFKIFSSNKLNHYCKFEYVHHVESQQLLKHFFKQRRVK